MILIIEVNQEKCWFGQGKDDLLYKIFGAFIDKDKPSFVLTENHSRLGQHGNTMLYKYEERRGLCTVYNL